MISLECSSTVQWLTANGALFRARLLVKAVGFHMGVKSMKRNRFHGLSARLDVSFLTLLLL